MLRSMAIVLAVLFLQGLVKAAATEFCGEHETVSVQGTIDEIEKAVSEGWLLYPAEGEESNCLYEAIFIHDHVPETCEPGAKFSLTGTMGPAETGDDTAIMVDTIECR